MQLLESGHMPAVALRAYQAEAVEAAEAFVAGGGRAGLLVAPTGSGKSVTLAVLAGRAVERGGRALVLTHVAELVAQDAAACARVVGGENVGIVSAGIGRRDLERPVTVASIQSVWRQPEALGRQDLVLIDEAHLISPEAGSGMYRRLLDGLEALGGSTPLIGLTATPWRLASGRLDRPWRGNAPMFERVEHEVGIRDLIAAGYLARPVAKLTTARIDTSGVGVRQGEFAAGDLQAAVDVEAINRAIVAEIIERGHDRRAWIVFATGVTHAQNLSNLLREAGIAALAINGNTPSATRTFGIEKFKGGELRALVSMNVLTTEFDAPAVDLIALCRPTLSPGLRVQMIGRGTRLSPETGKRDCLVLDFAGNCLRHGPLDLIDGAKRDRNGHGEAPAKACPECSSIIAAAARVCPDCGHAFVFEAKEAKLSTAAQSAPMLSDDAEEVGRTWLPVLDVRYALHVREGKPPSLRIEYRVPGHRWPVREWLAFESYSEVGRRIARSKWRDRTAGSQAPMTSAEALDRVRELRVPARISIRPHPTIADVAQVVSVDVRGGSGTKARAA